MLVGDGIDVQAGRQAYILCKRIFVNEYLSVSLHVADTVRELGQIRAGLFWLRLGEELQWVAERRQVAAAKPSQAGRQGLRL